MSSPDTLVVSGCGLTIADVYRVASGTTCVVLDEAQLGVVGEAAARIRRWTANGHPIYGATTGFGEMVHLSIPARFATTLQENLLRTHAAGAGPVFPDDVVRAILLARLNCLAKGH